VLLRVREREREREREGKRWNGGTGMFLYEREGEEFANRV